MKPKWYGLSLDARTKITTNVSIQFNVGKNGNLSGNGFDTRKFLIAGQLEGINVRWVQTYPDATNATFVGTLQGGVLQGMWSEIETAGEKYLVQKPFGTFRLEVVHKTLDTLKRLFGIEPEPLRRPKDYPSPQITVDCDRSYNLAAIAEIAAEEGVTLDANNEEQCWSYVQKTKSGSTIEKLNKLFTNSRQCGMMKSFKKFVIKKDWWICIHFLKYPELHKMLLQVNDTNVLWKVILHSKNLLHHITGQHLTKPEVLELVRDYIDTTQEDLSVEFLIEKGDQESVRLLLMLLSVFPELYKKQSDNFRRQYSGAYALHKSYMSTSPDELLALYSCYYWKIKEISCGPLLATLFNHSNLDLQALYFKSQTRTVTPKWPYSEYSLIIGGCRYWQVATGLVFTTAQSFTNWNTELQLLKAGYRIIRVEDLFLQPYYRPTPDFNREQEDFAEALSGGIIAYREKGFVLLRDRLNKFCSELPASFRLDPELIS